MAAAAASRARPSASRAAAGALAAPERLQAPPLDDLSTEQRAIYDEVVNSRTSLFFTGSAGTGKSYLLRKLVEGLRHREGDRAKVAVTAPTGIAAFNVNGTTLHSFMGAGLALETPDKIVRMLFERNPKAVKRWTTTSVLVIDEISMVDAAFFDKMNHVAQAMRHSNAPMGGIQVIMVGDFTQLPPVAKNGERVKYVFQSAIFQQVVPRILGLTQIFRQKDPEFVALLNAVRMGQLTPEIERRLKSLDRPLKFTDGIEPTRLYSLRAQVKRDNEQRLLKLETERRHYRSSDSGTADAIQKLDQYCSAPKELELRVGAQVMLIRNLDQQFVNGTIGKVVGFDVSTNLPIVSFLDQNNRPSPPDIVKFQEWELHDPNTNRVIATRSQVPLILAWAISIHKAQGQTLQRVTVDLSSVFEKGQAYVALSRATSFEGLEVRGFRSDVIQADLDVLRFCDMLQAPAQATR